MSFNASLKRYVLATAAAGTL
ncbi:MAG: hypothetical protein RL758_2061, partial [Pseudomonadota bacterium]